MREMICIKKGQWLTTNYKKPVHGPSYGELVLVDGIQEYNPDMLLLVGYNIINTAGIRMGYHKSRFIDVPTDQELEQLLEPIPETVTV